MKINDTVKDFIKNNPFHPLVRNFNNHMITNKNNVTDENILIANNMVNEIISYINHEEEKRKKINLFLSELTNLSNKYDIKIAGCGCCGSPYLIDLDNKNGEYVIDKNYENLSYEVI